MGFSRIGNKTIDRCKIYNTIDTILDMRCNGMSQQDVAKEIGVDRSFISRLETVGEVRRGHSIAFIAFPVQNTDEIIEVLDEYGINFRIIMTEQERLSFAKKRTGIELINDIFNLIAEVRQYDTLVVFASDKRSRLIQTLVDSQVVARSIGASPITSDVYISPDEIREVLDVIIY